MVDDPRPLVARFHAGIERGDDILERQSGPVLRRHRVDLPRDLGILKTQIVAGGEE